MLIGGGGGDGGGGGIYQIGQRLVEYCTTKSGRSGRFNEGGDDLLDLLIPDLGRDRDRDGRGPGEWRG